MCINLLAFWDDEGKVRTPVIISSKTYPNTIDILNLETGVPDGPDNDSGSGHYTLIKNVSTFMADIKATQSSLV